MSATDMYDNLNKIDSVENIRLGHLNLQKIRMTPLHFCLLTQT